MSSFDSPHNLLVLLPLQNTCSCKKHKKSTTSAETTAGTTNTYNYIINNKCRKTNLLLWVIVVPLLISTIEQQKQKQQKIKGKTSNQITKELFEDILEIKSAPSSPTLSSLSAAAAAAISSAKTTTLSSLLLPRLSTTTNSLLVTQKKSIQLFLKIFVEEYNCYHFNNNNNYFNKHIFTQELLLEDLQKHFVACHCHYFLRVGKGLYRTDSFTNSWFLIPAKVLTLLVIIRSLASASKTIRKYSSAVHHFLTSVKLQHPQHNFETQKATTTLEAATTVKSIFYLKSLSSSRAASNYSKIYTILA